MKLSHQKGQLQSRFRPLKGELLRRFRTRGQRRSQRSRLSSLWPPIWLPPSRENTEQISDLTAHYDLVSVQDQLHSCSIYLTQSNLSIRDAEQGTVLFELASGMPWFSLSLSSSYLEEERGFFHIRTQSSAVSRYVALAFDTVKQPKPQAFEISGFWYDLQQGKTIELRWTFSVQVLDRPHQQRCCQVHLELEGFDSFKTARPELKDLNPQMSLHLKANREEYLFGLGAQMTWLNLKGRIVPSWVQEPGIGRGIQPLTWVMERLFSAGGSDVQSSYPSAVYMTSELQTHALENKEFALFDFSVPHLRSIQVWSSQITMQVFSGTPHPLSRLESLSLFTGRMPALPQWVHHGAIIGIQGGTQRVQKIYQALKKAKVSISAFWIQDWVGKRETSVGEQLWWDWKLNQAYYPNWAELVSRLKADQIHVLGYLNPYLVPTTDKVRANKVSTTHSTEQETTSLFQTALEKGYLIKDPKRPSQALMVKNTSFSAAIVDLSDPKAFRWLKQVIKDRLIDIGMKGWMADFGEALPVEAQLKAGLGVDLHNKFAELWAKLNRELIDEVEGEQRELLYFNRAGFTQSPQYNHLSWLGDQLCSWNKKDGIYSGLVGLLSSGFSGISLSHSDVGGYICTDPPRSRLRIPYMSYVRSPELLMRWVEMNTFTAVLRTHEGNQPQRHHQIYDDDQTIAHFAKMSRLYKALAPIRISLMKKVQKGWPLVAHPWLYFPDDPHCLELQEQMMLGPNLMIAPVIRQGWKEVKVYLPQGEWGHWWSQTTFTGPCWLFAPAPIGEPAVFYRIGSECETLAQQWCQSQSTHNA